MATYFVRADSTTGGDGTANTTSGATRAWTFADMMTGLTSGSVAAGDTIWLVGGGGTFARTTTVDAPTKVGTAILPIMIRGCNATPNDLDVPTYNADGTLNYTGYPKILYTTGRFAGGSAAFMHIRGIVFSGAPANYMVYLGNDAAASQCVMIQTANSGSAYCFYTGTRGDAHNCDFVGNSGTLGGLVDTAGAGFTNCRFSSVGSKALIASGDGLVACGCTFYAPVGTSAVAIDSTSTNTGHEITVIGCTIVGGWDIGIRFANAANARLPHIVNNHITGCLTAGIKTLYTTSMRPALIAGNRFRDNGTGGNVVGFDNWYGTFVGLNTLTAGTDAGDFVNPASNDYRVRSGSAGATAAGGGGAAGGRGGVGGSGVLQRPGRAGRF